MPALHGIDEPERVDGEAGEITWKYGQVGVTSVSSAKDLGGGFVVQYLRNGNSCHVEATTVVQDCATGEAVAFGGQIGADAIGQREVLQSLTAQVEEHAGSGAPLSIPEVSGRAQAIGAEFVISMRTDSRLGLGPFEFDLGPGCGAFYYDLTSQVGIN